MLWWIGCRIMVKKTPNSTETEIQPEERRCLLLGVWWELCVHILSILKFSGLRTKDFIIRCLLTRVWVPGGGLTSSARLQSTFFIFILVTDLRLQNTLVTCSPNNVKSSQLGSWPKQLVQSLANFTNMEDSNSKPYWKSWVRDTQNTRKIHLTYKGVK